MKKLVKTVSFCLLLCMMVFATGCGNTGSNGSQNDMAGNAATQEQANTDNQNENAGTNNGTGINNGTGTNNGTGINGTDNGSNSDSLNNSVTDPAGSASDGNHTLNDANVNNGASNTQYCRKFCRKFFR